MSVYKLAGTGSGGTEDQVGQLDIQFAGTITAIHGTLAGDLDADGNVLRAEASFISSNSFGSNDARGSVFEMTMMGVNAGAGGFVNFTESSGVGPVDIPVIAGERMWLHIEGPTSTVSHAAIYIYVQDGASPDVRRRR